MPDQPYEQKISYDVLSTFDLGMNSGVAPLLLPRNQLAFGTNLTVRGDFMSPRAAIRKLDLTFAGSEDILLGAPYNFQGAAYYKPDTGAEQLALAVAGHLLIFTPSATAQTATVAEIPIIGLPMPATQPQAWMWQSEKWLIWQDGVSNPIFYDGATARHSTFGARTDFNVLVQVDFIVPALGAIVNVTFTGVVGMNVGDVITFKNFGQGIVVQLTGGNTADIYNQSMVPLGTKIIATTPVTWSHGNSSELPPGRMGAYGRGRNWFSLTDGRQFIASDITGGPSGTQAENFRDAVLHITENAFLVGGGNFAVPGSIGDIRAMLFTSELDVSLGQGPLLVVTPNVTFSCQAPAMPVSALVMPGDGQ